MDIDFNDFVDVYKANIAAHPPPVMETVEKLCSVFSDADSFQEAIDDINRVIKVNPLSAMEKLNALERLLVNPPKEEGVLAELVAWEANWVLENPNDEGARKWLQEVADTVRELLGDKAPPKPTKT